MTFPKPFYRYRPHPWHGLEAGVNPPEFVNAFIEITPFDSVKYEVDKLTGYLLVDRPQRSSSIPPTLYGFVPRTYCHDRVRDLMPGAKKGDGDPLDICVFSERPIDRSEVILRCHVVGGLQMLDDGEADDKIIAILKNDQVWEHINDISDFPSRLIERLQHYFETYKLVPGEENRAQILSIYGKEHAYEVVKASMLDYEDVYGG